MNINRHPFPILLVTGSVAALLAGCASVRTNLANFLVSPGNEAIVSAAVDAGVNSLIASTGSKIPASIQQPLATTADAPAMLPPEERPMHVRVTRQGVKLRFFHTTKAIPPFKINLPLEQWEQLVQLIAASKPGAAEWEGYVGFNEQLLALHRIDAVPAE